MTKKIFRSIALATLVVMIATMGIILGVLYDYFTLNQQAQLAAQVGLIAQAAVDQDLDFYENLDTYGYRLTWIDQTGKVLFDNQADIATMDNHANREEVQEAYATGQGHSSRRSETLLSDKHYAARKLPDGTVVRIAASQYTVAAFLMMMAQPITIILLIAAILGYILASGLSKRIVTPLNNLNLDKPLENDVYEEIAPLLNRIARQHRVIEARNREVDQRQREFETITAGMEEGLLLLGEQDRVISINRAAAKFLGITEKDLGKDLLEINRDIALQRLVSEAHQGIHGEAVINLRGRDYQFDASPIITDNKVAGIVILIFDITDKMDTERMRREFTANVSHELKTPLHFISGGTELLKNGMVRDEDLPDLMDKIHHEAQRMIELVNNIISLSQLDEGVRDLPREEVDLLEICQEVIRSLDESALERDIKMTLTGQSAVIPGAIRQLVYGIAYNLCSNAIKYNKVGGTVNITVKEDDKIHLIVKDTGIGMTEESQKRIFERFYRVDKSRSKEIEGTGLGLSIVKHAAKIHNATIHVESQLGEGTEITVSFPKTNSGR